MLALISPAKTLDFESELATAQYSQPHFLEQSAKLVAILKDMAPHELSALMSISDKLGALNYDRYQQWAPPFSPENARQAILAFKGDVYTGLDAASFDEAEFRFAQNHLSILSGLYGLLRPLDLIQPYRLEMGTRLVNERGGNLYQFWGDTITEALDAALAASGSRVLINLASNEYFKSVKPGSLGAEIITPVFKEYRSGSYKIISFLAKKARGAMVSYMVRHGLDTPAPLKQFDEDGYAYSESMSTPTQWVFTRES